MMCSSLHSPSQKRKMKQMRRKSLSTMRLKRRRRPQSVSALHSITPHGTLHLSSMCQPCTVRRCTRSCTAQEPASLSAMLPGHGRGMLHAQQRICRQGLRETALQIAQVHHWDCQPMLSRSLACRSDSEEWEPRRTSRGTARSSGGKAATKGASQPVSTPSPSVDKPRHSQQLRQKQKSMQVSARAGCDSACTCSWDPVWPACCQLSQSGCTCMGIRGSIEYMLHPSACLTCLQPYC